MTENPTGSPDASGADEQQRSSQNPYSHDPSGQAPQGQPSQGHDPSAGGQAPPPYGGYQQPYGYGNYQYPYGPGQPMPGYNPYMDPQARSRLVAGLLGIFLGGLGIHRFYLGFTTIGVWQIVVTFVTCGFGSIWGLVEGIMYLASNDPSFLVDADGRPLTK